MRFVYVLLVLGTMSLLLWGATHRTPPTARHANASEISPRHWQTRTLQHRFPLSRPAAWSGDGESSSTQAERDRAE